MEESQSVVSVDVSKSEVDIALLLNGKMKSKVLDNSPAGHADFLEWLGKSKAA